MIDKLNEYRALIIMLTLVLFLFIERFPFVKGIIGGIVGILWLVNAVSDYRKNKYIYCTMDIFCAVMGFVNIVF